MAMVMIPLMIAGGFDGVEPLSDVLCPPKSKALTIRRKQRPAPRSIPAHADSVTTAIFALDCLLLRNNLLMRRKDAAKEGK